MPARPAASGGGQPRSLHPGLHTGKCSSMRGERSMRRVCAAACAAPARACPASGALAGRPCMAARSCTKRKTMATFRMRQPSPRMSWLSCLSTARTASAGTASIPADAACKGARRERAGHGAATAQCVVPTAGGSRSAPAAAAKPWSRVARRPAILHIPVAIPGTEGDGAGCLGAQTAEYHALAPVRLARGPRWTRRRAG